MEVSERLSFSKDDVKDRDDVEDISSEWHTASQTVGLDGKGEEGLASIYGPRYLAYALSLCNFRNVGRAGIQSLEQLNSN